MNARQRRPTYVAAVVLACVFGLLAACSDEGDRRELRGGTMGTTWSVVYANKPGVSPDSLRRLIQADLDGLNQSLSTYIPESEISLLNERALKSATVVSPMFAEVLEAALAIGEQTNGAYDVTVGPLIDLWGFGSRGMDDRVPDRAAIDEAKAVVGAGSLGWDRASRQLSKPAGLRIDFSSIAKGYAVDRLASLLKVAGLEDFLVEIGGEIRASGERPGGGAWRLAVESPRRETGGIIEVLALRDVAVATSGDYRNYFEVDGKRYSHLVDPRTGYPVSHDLVSVTVVHQNCMQADAWATALIVLGREEAMALATELDLAIYLVASDGDQLTVEYSDAFSSYLAISRGAGSEPGG